MQVCFTNLENQKECIFQVKPYDVNEFYSKKVTKGEVCMKLYLAGGKFTKQCMVGNGGKTERVCSKKEPCPKKAKYNFEDEKRYNQYCSAL